MKNKFIKTLGFIIVLSLLSSCALQVAKITTTKSGKPEVLINIDNINKVKELIIADMINYNYEITKDTQYSLEMERPTKAEEEFLAMLIAGNLYSSNFRVVSFTILRLNQKIKVVVNDSIRARLPGGQINTVSIIDRGNTYNYFQRFLFNIKKLAEEK